jgi:hypothetical protein
MTGVLPTRIPNIINLLINDGPGYIRFEIGTGQGEVPFGCLAGRSKPAIVVCFRLRPGGPPPSRLPSSPLSTPTYRPTGSRPELSVILLPVFTSVPILGRLTQVASSLRRSAAMSSSAPAAQATLDDAPNPPSWFAHLPSPKATPQGISVEELHAALQEKGQELVLVVDVRRADIEVRPRLSYWNHPWPPAFHRHGTQLTLSVLGSTGTGEFSNQGRHQPPRADVPRNDSGAAAFALKVCVDPALFPTKPPGSKLLT